MVELWDLCHHHHHHHHHHHRLICKQLKQIITTVKYVKDSRHNQAETAPTVALDTTNTSTEHQKINKTIQSKKMRGGDQGMREERFMRCIDRLKL